MLTKQTIIGVVVGGIISAIGIYALLLSFSLIPVVVNDKLDPGGFTSYSFFSPPDTQQSIVITGDTFHVITKTPYNGPQLNTTVKTKAHYEWYPLEEGDNIIEIKNIGNSEVKIEGKFETGATPMLFIFHMLVLTTGLVIIGVSAGFSTRKPRGF